MRIAVLSDTHDVISLEVLAALEEVGHIVHAGDVGAHVLEDLRSVGPPVHCVAGNTDDPALGLPLELRLDLGGVRALVRHIAPPPRDWSAQELQALRSDGVRLVIFGHTHRHVWLEREGIMFLNPGSVSLPRGGESAAMGYLDVESGEFRFERWYPGSQS